MSSFRTNDSGLLRWLPAVLAATALVAALCGAVVATFMFPRTLTVEKPVEVIVEKRVEVPVEKPVIVEKRVELPPPPFSYEPVTGGKVTVSSDDLRVALLMRDAIRKAGDEPKIAYDSEAIFPPTKKLKVLVTPNAAVVSVVDRADVRAAVAAAFVTQGFVVLDDDAEDGDWNTLVHVEIDGVLVSSKGLAGRVSVSLRQGMLGFSNSRWRKVNLPIVSFSEVRSFGADPSSVVVSIARTQARRAATDLASKLTR
jgi:hypothetical protein